MENIMVLSQSELTRIVQWFSVAELEGLMALEDYELVWKIGKEADEFTPYYKEWED